jgi:hypothetical protein
MSRPRPVCSGSIVQGVFGINLVSLSFHSADRRTYRRVMFVGLLFCAAFVAISFFLRRQADNDNVLIKADKLVRTAGRPTQAN